MQKCRRLPRYSFGNILNCFSVYSISLCLPILCLRHVSMSTLDNIHLYHVSRIPRKTRKSLNLFLPIHGLRHVTMSLNSETPRRRSEWILRTLKAGCYISDNPPTNKIDSRLFIPVIVCRKVTLHVDITVCLQTLVYFRSSG